MRLNLSYIIGDPDIVGGIAFIEQRRYVIQTMVPPGYERYFQERARYESAHTSTAIEGNPLDEESAMQVLAEGVGVDSPAATEKLNLDQAYELMSLLTQDKATQIDEGTIRTINSVILRNLPDYESRGRGRYRLGQNQVVDSVTHEVRYRPPPAEWVPELMKSFIDDVNQWRETSPGPVAAALAHFGLISIHPFDNGNGRTARLLADMVLDLTGYSAHAMMSVSNIILGRHQEYYDSLREAQGDDYVANVDVTPFVRFHMGLVADAAIRLEEKVVAFNRRREAFRRQTPSLHERQVTGLMFMIDVGHLSTSVYARMTRSSQATALTDLAELVSRSIVVREGAGRNTRYSLNPEIRRQLGVERQAATG